MSKKQIALFLAICFLGGFIYTAVNHRPRVKLGKDYIYCNPGAKVKAKRVYKLRLWDTDWPVQGYKDYLEKMIRNFQVKYPNIKVQISLLDLSEAPVRLAAALKDNSAPDIYCSAFAIPDFNLKRQIPVGFYLKKAEKEAYFPEARKLVARYGVECYFPRWIAPTIWIGNQYLLRSFNLPVERFQKKGYRFEELNSGIKKTPPNKYILVGSLAHNGFFTDLAVNSTAGPDPADGFLPRSGAAACLNYLNNLLIERKIPSDFESNMIWRFMAGNSLVLAGVRPIIYRFLKLKLSENPDQELCEPLLLPSPSVLEKKVLLTENGVVCIYRNSLTSGDDQITAAVKLGQFISTYELTEPFQEMMLIPAAQKSAARWYRELKPVIGDVSYLIEQVENSSLLNLPDYRMYQQEIYPALQEFFAGKAAAGDVMDRLGNVRWE